MQKRKMDLPVALYLLHYTDESDCNANPPIDDGARSRNMTLPKHNLAANGGVKYHPRFSIASMYPARTRRLQTQELYRVGIK
mmetsp:Transcript_21714/g.36963  ORF Transcript_21714/g.36963 Transcript_21714/m.36963 type:complete len:82 (-) Transcript_21714:151-396(-)